MFKFFRKLFKPTSVNAILADFRNKVADLREHGTESIATAHMHTSAANELMAMASEHHVEAVRAHAVADKIEALIAA